MTRIIKRKRLTAMESILALAGMLAAQACFGGPRYAAPAPNYGPYGVYSSGDYQNREWHNSEWWAKNHPQWTHQHHPNWTVASEHHQEHQEHHEQHENPHHAPAHHDQHDENHHH